MWKTTVGSHFYWQAWTHLAKEKNKDNLEWDSSLFIQIMQNYTLLDHNVNSVAIIVVIRMQNSGNRK